MPNVDRDAASLCGALDRWQAASPRVRRAVAFGASNVDDLYVLVDVEPAMDSDEIAPVWLACAEAWRRELQERTGCVVHLAWMEPTDALAPALEWGRASLSRMWSSTGSWDVN